MSAVYPHTLSQLMYTAMLSQITVTTCFLGQLLLYVFVRQYTHVLCEF